MLDSMYDVFACTVDDTHLVIDEVRRTGIYLPGDHRMVFMLRLVLTDLDRQ
jgi:hypothetical protein